MCACAFLSRQNSTELSGVGRDLERELTIRTSLDYCIYRVIGFFEWACHIKNVDILGGTPTWDLDVPVHGTVANHAGGQVSLRLEVEPGLRQCGDREPSEPRGGYPH